MESIYLYNSKHHCLKKNAKKTFIFFHFLFIFSFIFSKNAFSQIPNNILPNFAELTPLQQKKAKNLEVFFQKIYENNQFNGSVLIQDSGKILLHKAYGFANFTTFDTMRITTPMRLASVSKQFTAVAIMMLYEQGKLTFDDQIHNYLPELPAVYKGITIRHLLNHTSGLADYFGLENHIYQFYAGEYPLYNRDLLDYFVKFAPKLNFKIGKGAGYSNTGYVFLALIVERISKKSFHKFLQDHIFKPLNMRNSFVHAIRNTETVVKSDTIILKKDTIFQDKNETRVEVLQKVIAKYVTQERKRAYGFALDNIAVFKPYDFQRFDGMVGEKGICVSTADFLLWEKAILENKIFKAETMRQALDYPLEADFGSYYYGFGWCIPKAAPHVSFHHGLYSGFRTYAERTPSTQRLVVILNNTQIGGQLTPIILRVNKILLDVDYTELPPTYYEKSLLNRFELLYKIRK